MIIPRISIFIIAAIVCLLFSPIYASGIGIAPAQVHFSSVLRGGYAQTVLTITNPNNVSTVISFSPTGQTKNYLYFFSSISNQPSGQNESIPLSQQYPSPVPIQNMTVGANSNALLWVIAKPSVDLAVGNYTGAITFYAKPLSNEFIKSPFGTGIDVAVEIPSYMEITGEQKVDFSVGGVSVSDAEVGYPMILVVSGANNGNVRAIPQVYIKILDRDRTKVLREAWFNGTECLPTTTLNDKFNVSSENLSEGQYWANVSVYIGGKLIKQELVTFDILEQGALKRSGELVQISGKVWPRVGEIIKIDAIFQNTGELSTNAKFRGEVYLNGTLVSVLESEEMSVPVGEKVNLTTYFTPKEPGVYNVKGVAYYSKKVTFEKELILNVLQGKEMSPLDNSGYVILAILVLVIIILMYILRGR